MVCKSGVLGNEMNPGEISLSFSQSEVAVHSYRRAKQRRQAQRGSVPGGRLLDPLLQYLVLKHFIPSARLIPVPSAQMSTRVMNEVLVEMIKKK
jgi:hypothetical protein